MLPVPEFILTPWLSGAEVKALLPKTSLILSHFTTTFMATLSLMTGNVLPDSEIILHTLSPSQSRRDSHLFKDNCQRRMIIM